MGREISEEKRLIGKRIRDIRKKRKLTQEGLAEKTDINPKYLSSIERGKENPTLDMLIRIAGALDTDPGNILRCVQSEDPKLRKQSVLELVERADSEQLKLAYEILSVIIR